MPPATPVGAKRGRPRKDLESAEPAETAPRENGDCALWAWTIVAAPEEWRALA